ncbi:MAG TPA: formate dehydrogenase accessory sulfurtransferase FdhD [Bacillota bacterium]|nr:formate dehydrogenase accessory sulfurtransferase FdhD [Bacillota bacterium]HUM55600.1 formate dehydrogenase accessory sulfurtransferase FdhD [Bacillota bacterium]
MKIIAQYENFPVSKPESIKKMFKGSDDIKEHPDPVIQEHFMDVYVNGVFCFDLCSSPCYLEQLVTGHLLAQGHIKNIKDIEKIEIKGLAAKADVTLAKGRVTEMPVELKDAVRIAMGGGEKAKKAGLTPLSLVKNRITGDRERRKEIFIQAETLYESSEVFFETGAAHSSSLAFDGEIKYSFYDVSRHNTVDKVIGQALIDGTDLSKAVLFTSGRIPLDMIVKAVRCRIPIVCSRSAPSGEALKMARICNVSLAGFVRGERMNIYND